MRKSCLKIVLFVASLLIFTQYACGSDNNPDWMTQNQNILQGLALNKVVLLGSHDAASCDIHKGSRPVTGYLTHSDNHIRRSARAKDVESGVCQSGSIANQLNYGVRYFDLRIAHQDGEYWGCHMWLSTPLLGSHGVFTQFLDFIKKHPGEILILNLNELYSDRAPMTDAETTAFYNLVNGEFGELLVPRANFPTTTLGQIWQTSGRIIVIGNVADDKTSRQVIWDDCHVDSKWMNAQGVNVLIDELQSKVLRGWERGDCVEKLRVLQAMQTDGHKLKKAEETNERIAKKLLGDWKKYPLNIIQVDDTVNSNLMPVIITLNQQKSAQYPDNNN